MAAMPGWLDVGLTLDPGQPLRVGSECLGENLQRDLVMSKNSIGVVAVVGLVGFVLLNSV